LIYHQGHANQTGSALPRCSPSPRSSAPAPHPPGVRLAAHRLLESQDPQLREQTCTKSLFCFARQAPCDPRRRKCACYPQRCAEVVGTSGVFTAGPKTSRVLAACRFECALSRHMLHCSATPYQSSPHLALQVRGPFGSLGSFGQTARSPFSADAKRPTSPSLGAAPAPAPSRSAREPPPLSFRRRFCGGPLSSEKGEALLSGVLTLRFVSHAQPARLWKTCFF